jgi:Zn-dependent protease with chaperone function
MKKTVLNVSIITMVGLYAMLTIILFGIALLCELPLAPIVGISIVIVVIQFLIAPWITDLTTKYLYRSNFNYQLPEYLMGFLDLTCSTNNMKIPKIGIIDDGAPNAFTYGRTKNDARLILSRGVFELLNPDEVKAVVAHEIGHAVHYDMLFMTVAQVVPMVLYYIYAILSKSGQKSNSNNDKGSYTALIAVIAYVLYIISQYIILWLSRTREYYADEFSIEATRNPNALASSLVKIGFGLNISGNSTGHSVKDVGALGIFDSKTSKTLVLTSNNNIGNTEAIKNTMKWEMWNPWAFIYELSSTHPLISKRLLAISKYSQYYDQQPFISFDLAKPESYMDDFALELLIKYSSTIVFIVFTLLAIFAYTVLDSSVLSRGVLIIGVFFFLAALLLSFNRAHRMNRGFPQKFVSELLGEVKVSGVTSIPCELTGTVIGRGNPGCIFNEDFVIQDQSGIIFLDYNQPLMIINKVFALFKSPEYFNKIVKVKGWYRRSPVPYVEIFEMEVDGKKKKIYTYYFSIGLYVVLSLVLLILLFFL